MTDRPLSVGVTLDLHRGHEAGGHVKCWERFAEAATELPDRLDLAIYVLGRQETVEALAANVRFHAVRPRFGTERVAFLRQGAGHTDLALFHPRLATLLPQHDVLHHTHAFALSRTAVRVAQRHGLPLTASLHTDLQRFTEHYGQEILGRSRLGRMLLSSFRLDALFARRQARKVGRLLAPCRRVLISRQEDIARFAYAVDPARIGRLRRGIQLDRFSPAFRDRAWLQQNFGIAPEVQVLLFVGRLDESKRVLTLARAAKRLRDTGRPVMVLIAGEGAARAAVHEILGQAAVMPGRLHGDDLSRAYASSDLFVFPSDSEVFGNVVIEARASGLPVLVTDHEGIGARTMGTEGEGLVVPGQDPARWAGAIAGLLDDPQGRAEMGRRARAHVLRHWPSWRQVLEEDLLPAWQAAYDEVAAG